MKFKKIKIVHLISGLNAGGTEMMLHKLLSQIDSEKFENTVISMTNSSEGAVGKQIQALKIPLYTLSMTAQFINPLGLIRFILLLYKIRPDILQTWLYHSDLLGTLGYLISPVKKLVWNIRCSYVDFKNYSKMTGFSVKALSKLSFIPHAVIANSAIGMKHHQSLGYKPENWGLIPNGFDLEKYQPNPLAKSELEQLLNLKSETHIIGMVARFDPLKDHKCFINAALLLLEKRKDIHFILIGRDVTKENAAILSMFKGSENSKHFHLLGEQTNVPQLIAGFTLFTLSSEAEGFPNVIGEAMASGIPCVVTDAGDSSKIVGDTGLVVPIKNPEALANAWELMLCKPQEELTQLGQRARKRIETQYNLSLIVNRYETFYQELLKSRIAATNSIPAQ